MKKLLALVLVLIMVFALSACRGGDDSGTYSSDNGDVSDNQGSNAIEEITGNNTSITFDDTFNNESVIAG